MLQSLIPFFSGAWAFFLLLVGFGFIIFIHELGHFLVAKAVGIKVTQFAVGFGPCLISWRRGLGLQMGSSEPLLEKKLQANETIAHLGETEYRLSAVPLGGYVKMLGQEDLDPTAQSQDPRAYNRKPIWARICVISAGVTMNLIFGILFFVVAFTKGVGFNAPLVGQVTPKSPAALTYPLGHESDPAYQGLRMGDHIVALNDQPVADLQEVRINTALAHRGQIIKLTVARDDQTLTYPITPEAGPRQVQGLLWLGFDAPASLHLPEDLPKDLLPQSLADAGVQPGMMIVAVNNQPVDSYVQFHRLVTAARGQDVLVAFAHPAKKSAVSPAATQPSAAAVTVTLHALPDLWTHDVQDSQPVDHILGLSPAVSVVYVQENMPAHAAGLQRGDVIARLGDVDWPSSAAVYRIVQTAKGSLDLVVLRSRELISLGPVTPKNSRLGFQPGYDQPVIRESLKDYPTTDLALTPGSRILALNAQPVTSVNDLQRQLADLAAAHPQGLEVNVTVELNVKDHPTEQHPLKLDAPQLATLASAAWSPPIPPTLFKYELVILKADTPLQAIQLGLEKTYQSMAQVYLTIARLFQGTVKPEHLQGPVGIIHTGTRVAKQGWSYLMFFLGLISINLVVINFLPIPIMDGGHIVFLTVEKLKGSPISERFQNLALYAGLAVIGSIFFITFYYDITRLFGG
ncbi:MAG: site-2 protease family protein [Phycisphaeraceae bacterium]|nr:site-2 protease family protein [Phycisphaeraceae bacterium]